MALVKLQRESVEKLELPVTTEDDPTSATVQFAFTDTDSPDERPGGSGFGAWVGGIWTGNPTGSQGAFQRTALTPLIGGAGLDLDVGKWNVWSKITLGQEIAVDKCGQVQIQ